MVFAKIKKQLERLVCELLSSMSESASFSHGHLDDKDLCTC